MCAYTRSAGAQQAAGKLTCEQSARLFFCSLTNVWNMACTVPKVKGHGVLRASPVSGQRLNDHEISTRNYNPIRWMISG
jgi:hypothetical protein